MCTGSWSPVTVPSAPDVDVSGSDADESDDSDLDS